MLSRSKVRVFCAHLSVLFVAITLVILSAGKLNSQERYGSIEGTVTDEAGNPLAGMLIDIYEYIPGLGYIDSASTASGEDGVYSYSELHAGDFRLYFGIELHSNSSKYIPEYYDNAVSLESAADITVGEGETVTRIDAQLSELPAISGLVTDENGEPLSLISASFYHYGSRYPGFREEWYAYETVQTNQNGAYFLDQVKAGRNLIRFSDKSSSSASPRYKDRFYQNAHTIESATVITATNNEQLVVETVQLEKLGSISGTVTDPDGNPEYAYVTVEAWDSRYESWEEIDNTETNSDGTYIIGGLEANSYHVRFEDREDDFGEYEDIYASELYSNVFESAFATDIVIDSGEDVTGIDAQMGKLPIIEGTVTGANGNPIGSAPVLLYAWNDNALFYDETGEEYYEAAWEQWMHDESDDDGLYRFRVAPDYVTGFSDAYRVCVDGNNDFLGQCYAGTENIESATDIQVNVNEVVSDADFVMTTEVTQSDTSDEPEGEQSGVEDTIFYLPMINR